MPQVMLKPGWPGGTFRRTVKTGKKPKQIVFQEGKPVTVSPAEYEALGRAIGASLFDVELDGRGKKRLVEPEVVTAAVDVQKEKPVGDVQRSIN